MASPTLISRPIIGVANTYSTITPCNMSLNVLAQRAEAAIKASGAMPRVFGTVIVSDGIAMGTERMKYSLVSRELIADSIETACSAQAMDGVVTIGGCDKNIRERAFVLSIGLSNLRDRFDAIIHQLFQATAE